MRKILVFILTLALLSGLALTAYAEQGIVEISDAVAEGNETFYLTVKLNGTAVGDTMGITFAYDDSLLEIVPTGCQWLKDGALEDFKTSNAQGVWAAADSADLAGEICMLAFRVRSGVAFAPTEVSCTLVVKNGATVVVQQTATASITQKCSHNFGEWESDNSLSHDRTCTLCGAGQSQSHSWDDGTLSENPQDPKTSIKTRTCIVCGGTKTELVPANNDISTPTLPSPTEPPEEPEPTRPTESTYPRDEEAKNPTNPIKDQFGPAKDEDEDEEENQDSPQENPQEPEAPRPTEGNPDRPDSGNPEQNPEQNPDQNQGDHDHPEHEQSTEPPFIIPGDDHSGHDHAPFEETEPPMMIPAVGDVHDHTHDHVNDSPADSQETDRPGGTIAAVIIVIAVVAAAAVLVVFERKKRQPKAK